jgi:hypothetical protein
MLHKDTKEAEKELKKKDKAEAKARKEQEKQDDKARKEREKAAKKSGQQPPQAPLSTSAAVFRAMPPQFIAPTNDNTAGMTDAERVNLAQHNMTALRDLAKEQGIDLNRPAAKPAAPARTEARVSPVIMRQPTPELKTPAKKSSSWFSSFCCLFTCCFGSRGKEQKESSTLLRKGIN